MVSELRNAMFFYILIFRATHLFTQVSQLREYVIRFYVYPVLPLPLCATARAYRQIFHY